MSTSDLHKQWEEFEARHSALFSEPTGRTSVAQEWVKRRTLTGHWTALVNDFGNLEQSYKDEREEKC